MPTKWICAVYLNEGSKSECDYGRNMDIEQLFSELSSAKSEAARQELVNRAMSSGIDQEQIREMLDYLECFGGEKKSPKDENSRN